MKTTDKEVKEVAAPADTATGTPEFTEEQKEFARMNVRKQFNETFSKWAVIADENATDADIEAARKEYDEAVDETKARTYILATAEGDCARRTADLLIKWNTKYNPWVDGAWRGVMTFDKFMKEKLTELKDGDDLVIDYNTLVFLYQSMSHPTGIGMESAKYMAELENYDLEKNEIREVEFPVTFSGILEKVQTEVNMLTAIDKKLTILRERVNLAYAGLRMDLKITDIDEFIEFADAINTQSVNAAMENKED